ncbi:hypothetical protein [Paraburkholderia sp. UCT31]|nr:hypothetical protein [Paraburkholderia sp. UCT31]
MSDDIIRFELVKTNRRLTFDISFQREDTRYRRADRELYATFDAGVEGH